MLRPLVEALSSTLERPVVGILAAIRISGDQPHPASGHLGWVRGRAQGSGEAERSARGARRGQLAHVGAALDAGGPHLLLRRRADLVDDGPISRRAQFIIFSSEVGRLFAGAIPRDGYGSRETSATNLEVGLRGVWRPPAGGRAEHRVGKRRPAATAIADETAPDAKLSGRTSQRVGAAVAVTIACPDEPCRGPRRPAPAFPGMDGHGPRRTPQGRRGRSRRSNEGRGQAQALGSRPWRDHPGAESAPSRRPPARRPVVGPRPQRPAADAAGRAEALTPRPAEDRLEADVGVHAGR